MDSRAVTPELSRTGDSPKSGPLAGKRVVVTRAHEQAASLAQLLAARGALPVELPTIRILPPDRWEDVDRCLGELPSYDWVIFTSGNAVRAVFDRLAQTTAPRGPDRWPKLAVIGPATARELEARGRGPSLVAHRFVAEGVVDAFRGIELEGRRVLYPRAGDARETIRDGLTKLGAHVDDVVVYRTEPSGDPAAARQLFRNGLVDAVTLTSASTARSLAALLGDDAAASLAKAVIASIGPITSAAAREVGLRVHVEAGEHTGPGLVAALEEYYGTRAARGEE
jgi:uroporphyrinogen-III synthase